ncbi:MAG: ABC transporter permease [Epsilonproteobacteria bacterium]|nr:ABC transporter permease [Campylobacterota bacterium]
MKNNILKISIYGKLKETLAKKRLSLNIIVGSLIIVFFLVISIFATSIAPYDADEMHYDNLKKPPSAQFLLGTDRYGRDILSRVIVGSRSTLLMATASTFLALIFGTVMGAASAYYGGRLDSYFMRLNDIMMSFPSLVFAMLVIGVLGASMLNGIIAIAIVYTPRSLRVVRSQALNIVHLEYIDAAKVAGESSLYIIFKEIIPNLWPTVIVEGSIRLGYAILLTASLGYIGLGPPPPTPDWGLMAYTERTYMIDNPWPVFAPSIAIVIAVIGVSIFGEGLKDMLLSKLSRSKGK